MYDSFKESTESQIFTSEPLQRNKKCSKTLQNLLPSHFKLRSMSVRSNRYGTFERFHFQRSHAMSESLSQHELIAKSYL